MDALVNIGYALRVKVGQLFEEGIDIKDDTGPNQIVGAGADQAGRQKMKRELLSAGARG